MSSIDIVIPCYRYGHYLRECVQSVLAQGVPQTRVLVIDDESPDETPEVARALAAEDPRVTYRRHARNRGHIETFNEGIAWCEADYMLLLSADDYLLAGALPRAMRLLDAHPAMTLCFGDALALGPDGLQRRMGVGIEFDGADTVVLAPGAFIRLCAASLSRNVVPTPTAIVRTALLRQTGDYHPELPHTSDMELWLRANAHGPVGVLKACQAVYRRHAANMSSAYYSEHHLADIEQRRLAIDTFLAGCDGVLPDARGLHLELRKGLSRDALGQASGAFNEGRRDVADILCRLAATLDPGVRNSLAWQRLVFKKIIGVNATNALLSIAAPMRSVPSTEDPSR